MSAGDARPLAVVTGASSGIGLELAKLAAKEGHDLIVAADEAEIETAALALRDEGVEVETVQADLATEEGVNRLLSAIGERPVAVLLANAGRGLGHAFLDQDLDEVRRVIDTNVTGTVLLTHAVANGMRARDEGAILFTGSIAGLMPGAFQAVYNATKSFVNSFSIALRNELKDTGVSVTCLMPGPTQTEFFDRAHMEDTPIGQNEKDDPAKVAADGWKALQKERSSVVSGAKNKAMATASHAMSGDALAEQHRKMAEPNK